MLKVVNLVRELHDNTVVIVDDYDKYYIYNRDCYVVYYLTKFKICGRGCKKYIINSFEYLNYLIKILKDNEVNYMVLVKRRGYNVSDSKFFLNNRYMYLYNKGKILYKRINDIDYIVRKMRCNILDNKEKIKYIKGVVVNGV